MMKLTATVCVDAPVSQVWAVLSDLDSIHLWSDSIHHAYCEGELTRGVDAIRVCELGGNVTIKEKMIQWDEGRSYTYIGQGMPLVKRAENTWNVEEHGSQTLVRSTAEVELKWGILGRLFEPVLLFASRQLGRKSLAAFKYLVENGRPYQGDASRLLPNPSVC
jgi:carbon monoxide dehydrogenase subunit G